MTKTWSIKGICYQKQKLASFQPFFNFVKNAYQQAFLVCVLTGQLKWCSTYIVLNNFSSQSDLAMMNHSSL